MFEITEENSIPVIRQAFLDEKLSAQQSWFTPNEAKCYYRDPDHGTPCAVGAILPDDVARRCDQHDAGTSIYSVSNGGLVRVRPEKLLDLLSRAQRAHDGKNLWKLGKILDVPEIKLLAMGYRPTPERFPPDDPDTDDMD